MSRDTGDPRLCGGEYTDLKTLLLIPKKGVPPDARENRTSQEQINETSLCSHPVCARLGGVPGGVVEQGAHRVQPDS